MTRPIQVKCQRCFADQYEHCITNEGFYSFEQYHIQRINKAKRLSDINRAKRTFRVGSE